MVLSGNDDEEGTTTSSTLGITVVVSVVDFDEVTADEYHLRASLHRASHHNQITTTSWREPFLKLKSTTRIGGKLFSS